MKLKHGFNVNHYNSLIINKCFRRISSMIRFLKITQRLFMNLLTLKLQQCTTKSLKLQNWLHKMVYFFQNKKIQLFLFWKIMVFRLITTNHLLNSGFTLVFWFKWVMIRRSLPVRSILFGIFWMMLADFLQWSWFLVRFLCQSLEWDHLINILFKIFTQNSILIWVMSLLLNRI